MDLLCSGRGAIRLPSRSTGAPGLAPNERGQGGLSAPTAPRGSSRPHRDGEAGSLLLLLGSCPCQSPGWLVATPGEAGAPSFPLLPGAGEGAGASLHLRHEPRSFPQPRCMARPHPASPWGCGMTSCCRNLPAPPGLVAVLLCPSRGGTASGTGCCLQPCRGAQQERCRCASTRTRTGSGAERWQTPALIKRPRRELALPACPRGTELGKDAVWAGTWARSWRGAIGAGSAPSTP